MNKTAMIAVLVGLLNREMGDLQDDNYKTKLQLKHFDKAEYTKKFGKGDMMFLSADEYEQSLYETVNANALRYSDLLEIKAWLESLLQVEK